MLERSEKHPVVIPFLSGVIMERVDRSSLEARLKRRIPILNLLRFRIVDLEAGKAVLEVEHDPLLEREGGMLFGGVIALLFDAVMGLSVFTVNDGGDQATVSLSIDFMRPARAEKYLVEGRVVRKGKRIVFVEGFLGDGKNLFARAHGVWYIK